MIYRNALLKELKDLTSWIERREKFECEDLLNAHKEINKILNGIIDGRFDSRKNMRTVRYVVDMNGCSASKQDFGG